MLISFIVFLDCVPLLLILFFISNKRININRDFLFLFFWLQVFIYINFCPTMSLFSLDLGIFNHRVLEVNSINLKFYYLLIKILILFFFQLPYIFIYLTTRKKLSHVQIRVFKVNHLYLVILGLLFIIFPLVFLKVSIATELFFKRIGHEAYSNRLASLSIFESLIYKYYYKSGLFILSVLLISILKTEVKNLKIFYLAIFFLNLGIFGFYELLNNRLQTVITIVYLFSVFTYFSNRNASKVNFNFSKIFFLAFFLFLTIKLVVNLRSGFIENGGELKIENFNPFASSSLDEENDKIYWRLNGIDLIARILPEVAENPSLDFHFYFDSFRVSFGSLWNDNFATERKNDLETTIKSQLIKKYFPYEKSIDYYSCSLTDQFGTLGLFGIFLFSIFHSNVFSSLLNNFMKSVNYRKLLFSLFLIPFFLVFEYESTVTLFGWIKIVPIYFILIIFPIFKITTEFEATHPKP